MQNTLEIRLGEGGVGWLNYEDNIGNTPMGANGLQKVEDLNNERRQNDISPGVQKGIRWVLETVDNESKSNKRYIMRVIYDSMRSMMLVVNMRVIYIRQNLAQDRC